jgi:hypothetical protein
MKMTIVATLSVESQYSENLVKDVWDRTRGSLTEFPICSSMRCVHEHEKDPECCGDDPSVCRVRSPVFEQKLSSRKVGGHRDRIVEPIVPRERKSVGGGEKAGHVCVERTYM